MNKDIEVVQKIKIRGHVLKMLGLTYPTATFESAVAAGLIERGLVSSPDISEYTSYNRITVIGTAASRVDFRLVA